MDSFAISLALLLCSCVCVYGLDTACEGSCILPLDSECIDKKCVCTDGKTLSSNKAKCLENCHTYDEECIDSVQCLDILGVGAICLDNKCACDQGFHYLQGKCFYSKGLGESCTNSAECASPDLDTESLQCKDNNCICADDFYLRTDQATCRRKGTPTECTINLDCVQSDPDSTCTTKKVCESTKKEKSFKKYNLTENTLSENQTLRKINSLLNLESSDICKPNCPSGYFEINSECLPELGTRDKDINEATCNKISSAIVRKGENEGESFCSCKGGYTADADNRKCTGLKTKTGSSCTRDIQCRALGIYAKCPLEQKKCTCTEDTYFYEEQQICIKYSRVGGECGEDYDCLATGGPDSIKCQDNVCTCQPGFIQVDKNLENGLDNDDCLAPSAPDKDCIVDEQCTYNNHKCKANKCNCLDGYFFLNKKECVKGIGSMCKDTNECPVLNSICTSKICSCPIGYLPGQTVNECLKAQEQTDTNCIEMEQCTFNLGKLSECVNNTCQCIGDSHFKNKICIKKIPLGEQCNNAAQCYVKKGPTRCLKMKCQCEENFFPSADKQECNGVIRTDMTLATLFLGISISLFSYF